MGVVDTWVGVVKVLVWSWNEMVKQKWGGWPDAEAIRVHASARPLGPAERSSKQFVHAPAGPAG